MYKIKKPTNTINPLDQKPYSSLGIREREHFQEQMIDANNKTKDTSVLLNLLTNLNN